jgi:hypothetical protein
VFPVLTFDIQCLLHVTVNLTRDLRSSGLVLSVEWYFLTDVSGQPSVPSLRGKKPNKRELLTFEDGIDRLSRKVGKELQLYAEQ